VPILLTGLEPFGEHSENPSGTPRPRSTGSRPTARVWRPRACRWPGRARPLRSWTPCGGWNRPRRGEGADGETAEGGLHGEGTGIAEAQGRHALAFGDGRCEHLVDTREVLQAPGGGGEQATVEDAAEFDELGQVLQGTPDADVVGVVDGGLGAQGAALLERVKAHVLPRSSTVRMPSVDAAVPGRRDEGAARRPCYRGVPGATAFTGWRRRVPDGRPGYAPAMGAGLC